MRVNWDDLTGFIHEPPPPLPPVEPVLSVSAHDWTSGWQGQLYST